jgi:hypothetical protein
MGVLWWKKWQWHRIFVVCNSCSFVTTNPLVFYASVHYPRLVQMAHLRCKYGETRPSSTAKINRRKFREELITCLALILYGSRRKRSVQQLFVAALTYLPARLLAVVRE